MVFGRGFAPNNQTWSCPAVSCIGGYAAAMDARVSKPVLNPIKLFLKKLLADLNSLVYPIGVFPTERLPKGS